MIKLEKCPECGNELTPGSGSVYFIWCRQCGLSFPYSASGVGAITNANKMCEEIRIGKQALALVLEGYSLESLTCSYDPASGCLPAIHAWMTPIPAPPTEQSVLAKVKDFLGHISKYTIASGKCSELVAEIDAVLSKEKEDSDV